MATMFCPSNHCLMISLPLKVPRVLISPLSTISPNPNPNTSLSSSLFVKPSETTLGMHLYKRRNNLPHSLIPPEAAEWIIDGGLLENIRDLVVPPILAADGSPLLEMTASAQKCGDVHLWGRLIILKDVRYLNIDGFKANVLSVGKLCDDSDAAVFFVGMSATFWRSVPKRG